MNKILFIMFQGSGTNNKHFKPIFNIPVISFINIENPEKPEKIVIDKNWKVDFDNKAKYTEIYFNKKNNPINYTPYIFVNKSHFIYNKKQPANKIIAIIKEHIKE
jgi:hypothetical protein